MYVNFSRNCGIYPSRSSSNTILLMRAKFVKLLKMRVSISDRVMRFWRINYLFTMKVIIIIISPTTHHSLWNVHLHVCHYNKVTMDKDNYVLALETISHIPFTLFITSLCG